ncbi:MAG TPA: hypothetical protein VJ400_06065 [Thermoplasmata archaeon]|nr:hypothetical protein [Thermoplasmata archaeon]
MAKASVQMEGIVPLALTDLWRLLSLHMDEDTVRAIHPWILEGRVVRDEGRASLEDIVLPSTHVVDRVIRVAGRTVRDTWTYRIEPPNAFAYEIRSPEGLVSIVRNTYREEGSGTCVVTDATLEFGRVPRFIQRRVGGSLLDRADAEDLAYLRRYGFRTIGQTNPKAK